MTKWIREGAAAVLLVAGAATAANAQGSGGSARFDIYGFAMLDMGYQSASSDPSWYDVNRPTKLPAYDNQFGHDGNFFAGVRQSRFGVKSWVPTDLGELSTIFEFELFGTGGDAGQTTFRLRHAWGQLGQFGAGQTWSPFMDPDVFPNSIEYWGPNGMVFFRNVQFRWMPLQGDTKLTFAIEKPGASGDGGVYSDRVEIQNIKARFPLPDFSAQFRKEGSWGHLQLAGIVRSIHYDDMLQDAFDLSGDVTGWGFNASSNIKIKKDVLRLSVTYGEGIENYMNDAPVDVGIKMNPGNSLTPVVGEALPVLGIVAFFDHTWNDKWSSTVGYSQIDITNSDGQSANAYHAGQYGLVNLLHYPAPNVMIGAEIQYGNRDNNSDGWSADDLRFQFSAKYNFKHSMGGK